MLPRGSGVSGLASAWLDTNEKGPGDGFAGAFLLLRRGMEGLTDAHRDRLPEARVGDLDLAHHGDQGVGQGLGHAARPGRPSGLR